MSKKRILSEEEKIKIQEAKKELVAILLSVHKLLHLNLFNSPPL